MSFSGRYVFYEYLMISHPLPGEDVQQENTLANNEGSISIFSPQVLIVSSLVDAFLFHVFLDSGI